MTIPLRPQEIAVPADNPFRDDLLDRKRTAESLTNVVRSFEGPGVIAIDAAWGTGKTTFLNMWVQHLRNQEFTVVKFNAWETDFATDPFLALSTELQNDLNGTGTSPDSIERFKECSRRILRHGLPDVVRLVSSGVPILGPVGGKITESVIETFTESRVSSYGKTKEAIEDFRKALEAIALETFSGSDDLPLVVVVDELDRCRPTYAVELLETAKHLFSVDHVVFVLAINRRELSHSVRSLYGSEFNADLYLRRFFDAEVSLPEPDLQDLTTNALRITGYDNLGAGIPDRSELPNARKVLVDLLKMSSVDARTVLQNVHVLGIVLGSTRKPYYALPFAAAVATVMRIHDANAFGELTRGGMTDEGAVRSVRSRCEDSAWSRSESASLFEAAIMCIVQQKARVEMRESMTPLLHRYKQAVGTPRTSEGARHQSAEEGRANDIVHSFEWMARLGGARGMTLSVQFDVAVARLRALSSAAG